MTYEPSPQEQEALDAFTMPPSKHGKGKSVVFVVKMYVHPDGTMYLSDGQNVKGRPVPYNNYRGCAVENAGEAFKLLCRQAVNAAEEHAQRQQAGD